MQFLDWDFSPDLSVAVHIGSGEEIHFTRAERSLLQALMSYRGRIWTRETLLNAVSGLSEEASHRSIDHIVNHLRHKLRDSARRPLYIETRYGECYVWIAESPDIQTRTRSALPPIAVRLNGNAVMSYCDRPHAERAVQGAVAVSFEAHVGAQNPARQGASRRSWRGLNQGEQRRMAGPESFYGGPTLRHDGPNR